MTFLICVVAFPLLAGGITGGCGLLAERASGGRLPGLLLAPLGLAVVVVVSQILAFIGPTAPLAPWVVLALAIAGVVLGWPRLRAGGIDRWAVGCAALVYASVAATVILSGTATFAAYGLDTTGAIHVMGADHLLRHGLDFSTLPSSNYQLALVQYFDKAYPSGSHTAFAALGHLTGQDLVWLYTEFMAICVALLALALATLTDALALRPWSRAALAFVAAQPALVYAYAEQGAIKELVALPLIGLLAGLVPVFARQWAESWRRLVPLGLAGGAGLGALGLAFGVWLGPVALGCLALILRVRTRERVRAAVRRSAAFVGLVLALGFPTVALAGKYLSSTGFLTQQSELGNLFGPLDQAQVFGVWLAGEYRTAPDRLRDTTWLLIGVAAAGALLGVAWLVRRRSWTLLFFLGFSLVACLYVVDRGSPWADAKALMIVSPAIVLVALCGAVGLARGGRWWEGATLALVIGCGVLGSNALIYHETTLADRGRLMELDRIGNRFAGHGPMLATEFEDYALWFLRDARPFATGDAWPASPTTLRNGTGIAYGSSHDLDELPYTYVTRFPAVLVRRSPAASRPPASYTRVWTGRFYDVWERPAMGGAQVLAHEPLGGPDAASSVPRCADVQRLANDAQRRLARLVVGDRKAPVVAGWSRLPLPSRWSAGPASGDITMSGPGYLAQPVAIASAGRYRVWLRGSFGRRVRVLIDGRSAGSVADAADEPGGYASLGVTQLEPGRHVVSVAVGGGDLRPGNGGRRNLGPVVLEPDSGGAAEPVTSVAPSRYRSLCGRPWDWLEVVR